MLINVVTQEGEIIILEVSPNDTIMSVKKKIGDNKEFDIPFQTLVFNGCILKDECILLDYEIEDDDTIDLLMKLHHPC